MPQIARDTARLEYTVAGTGAAILFVQGVGAIGRAWRPQLEAFATDHRVVAYDNRGIGGSPRGATPLSIELMAEDALAVADAAGLDRFHLVGHSMGGVIAQQVALVARPRVRSLSLLCTFATGAQASRLSWDLLVGGIRSRVGPRAWRRRAFMELVVPAPVLTRLDRRVLETELQDLFGRDLADQPPIVMEQLRATARYDARPRLSKLAGIPTLVASAECDRIALPAFGRELADAIPRAQFVELPGAGHAVPIHDAAAVNELLREHVAD
jgi:aminoacrylate hydrolase